MDNTTSLFIGAALGLIIGLALSFKRNKSQHLIINKINKMGKELSDEIKGEAAKTRASLQKIREDIARIAGGIVPSGGLTEAEAQEIKADLQGLAGEAAVLDAENEPPVESPVG